MGLFLAMLTLVFVLGGMLMLIWANRLSEASTINMPFWPTMMIVAGVSAAIVAQTIYGFPGEILSSISQ